MNENTPITISVPEAGKRYFGLSRNGSYDAAARGEIPTIKIGRLLRVPVLALERMIERASEPSGSPQRLGPHPRRRCRGRGPEV
jgi:Helix-turn-helix domain